MSLFLAKGNKGWDFHKWFGSSAAAGFYHSHTLTVHEMCFRERKAWIIIEFSTISSHVQEPQTVLDEWRTWLHYRSQIL